MLATTTTNTNNDTTTTNTNNDTPFLPYPRLILPSLVYIPPSLLPSPLSSPSLSPSPPLSPLLPSPPPPHRLTPSLPATLSVYIWCNMITKYDALVHLLQVRIFRAQAGRATQLRFVFGRARRTC